MTENKKNEGEKKKGIDLVVRSAIDRLVSAEQDAAAMASAGAVPAAAGRRTKTAAASTAEPVRQQSRKPRQRKPKAAESKETAGSPVVAPTEVVAPEAKTVAAAKTQPPAGKKRGRPKKNATAATSMASAAVQPARAVSRKANVRAYSGKPADEQLPTQSFHSNFLALHHDAAPGKPHAAAAASKKGDREYKLKIIPLGGLGEVGKNMTLIQYADDIIVVDGGVSFPENDMFGVDLVIPDYSYLIENKDKVRAFFLTHGHEDHIGAMPYILNDIQAPVYSAPLTLGLLRGKLNEHRINADLRQVAPREEVTAGLFRVEFIRLTHSIPDTMGLAVTTPVGVILLISDFKMDLSPIDGKQMDFGRISALGEKGVLLLMSDSTNAEREGFTGSERSVGANLERIFFNAPGRIIVTTFASHVHRVQQVMQAAFKAGRKVAVCGRGMQNMTAIAAAMGYLEVPDKTLVDIERVQDMPADQTVILTTGSQGEMMAGLTRMAAGEHKQVQIREGDTVVISATPIPGNDRMVSRTVDNLFRRGAYVYYERAQHIHVSGHASQEELKLLLNLAKPRYFMPIHGEHHMLQKHAMLAQQVGMAAENTIVMENGQVLELARRSYRATRSVESGRVFVDGLGVGDVGATVLRERRQLSEGGVIVVSMTYSHERGRGRSPVPKLVAGPDILTRGFIFEKEYEHIIGEMKEKVVALSTPERLADSNINDLRNQIRSQLSKFVIERTGRRPVIMVAVSVM